VLKHGYRATFAGTADYLPSSATASAKRRAALLGIVRVAAHPVHVGRCEAEMNGLATTAQAGACDSLILAVSGKVAGAATGVVQLRLSGGPPGARTIRLTATIHNGRWRTRVQLPGRNTEPGDRWTITATYVGDATHTAQTTSREILLEAEGPNDPRHL
jgi:hypothetical protein